MHVHTGTISNIQTMKNIGLRVDEVWVPGVCAGKWKRGPGVGGSCNCMRFGIARLLPGNVNTQILLIFTFCAIHTTAVRAG
jgi:hypothetical protein